MPLVIFGSFKVKCILPINLRHISVYILIAKQDINSLLWYCGNERKYSDMFDYFIQYSPEGRLRSSNHNLKRKFQYRYAMNFIQ